MKLVWDNLCDIRLTRSKNNFVNVSTKIYYSLTPYECAVCGEWYLIKTGNRKGKHLCCSRPCQIEYIRSKAQEYWVWYRENKVVEYDPIRDEPDAIINSVIEITQPAGKNRSRRGRPRGYKLSAEAKDRIAKSRKGKLHKQETKDKIKRAMLNKALPANILNRRSSHDGGSFICKRGYKNIYVGEGAYIGEHRWIAERVLGRPLKIDEIVHHWGGRADNRPKQLLVCDRNYHVYIHNKMTELNIKSIDNYTGEIVYG